MISSFVLPQHQQHALSGINYGPDAKSSHLEAALYKQDTPSNRIDHVDNTGLQTRATPFRTSVWVQVMAPIHCDLFAQHKYLISNVDLRLTLYWNSDVFCLRSPGAAAGANLQNEAGHPDTSIA